MSTAREARRPGQSSSAPDAAVNGDAAAGDSATAASADSAAAPAEIVEERKYEASTHMEVELVEVLGEFEGNH